MTHKYFKDPAGTEIYAYDADGSQDDFILPGLIPCSKAEADEIRFPFADHIIAKIAEIKNARDAAVGSGLTSAALGSPHAYGTQAENRNYLNNLISLGNGGKFTCTDVDGIKARRLHTHAQLLALAHDIEAHISAQFDHYETKLAEIDVIVNSPSPAYTDFDCVVW
ncbi:hypothetical protein B0F88_103116 [Methylobacter tundripaludum]|uniref:DUF4376 domain-containing protein n=1 Tax=Methylobacter tundripaludum TaxID=173365 RepID=A0A2S6H5G3_9GAMM|nr:hypothetical protein [Methylobacter tundripaludum]PPK72683.1 hypothetical protein B0F88_103116 [Methylobacter tundripaludum]